VCYYEGWKKGVCIIGERGIGIGFAWSLSALEGYVSRRVLEGL
jgi:hypothetical protein